MRVLVIAGGELNETTAEALSPHDYVIAVDSGLDHAEGIGIAVDQAVGDFDSVTPEALRRAREAGVVIDEHPAQKNETDLELGLETAMGLGATSIELIAAGGGRLDHLLGNLMLLANPAYQTAQISFLDGLTRGHVVHHTLAFNGKAGAMVSVIPIGSDAQGVTLEGFVYPLNNETLPAFTGRGISNEFVGGPATVTVTEGCLLVIQP